MKGKKKMGTIHTNIQLNNPREGALGSLDVRALVDTGSMMLCVPEHIKIQLKLDQIDTREVITADGRIHSVPYVGPIQIRFQNRTCFVGALVMGNEVLLGAVPMEDMDLVVSPKLRKVVVNPDYPNIAHAIVKAAA